MKPERKLYEKLKRNCNKISWIRLENLSLSGTPDLLGYNANSHFFTVELKVTKSNKIRFSPHQIAFHVKHPNNTFILVEHLGQRSVKLFPGSMIKELDACGLALEPLCLTLDACCLWLSELEAYLCNRCPGPTARGSPGAAGPAVGSSSCCFRITVVELLVCCHHAASHH